MSSVGLLFSCKEAFNPKINPISNNLLVVEGFINTGSDSTIIKLNRSVKLADQKVLNPEVGATVSIESETNQIYLLKEKDKGVYVTPALQLNSKLKYRLKIKTSKNVNYQSDFVEVKEAPPIDDLNWKVVDNGLQVYVNAHDDSNKTRYYRWEYTDTWIFNARFESLLVWNGFGLTDRTNNIFQCWGNSNSSTILLGSTAKLEKDVIFQSPIALLDHHAERLGHRYSILVKQYAITKEAYQFYEEIKKNTETLGSIFDAQPSEIKGNIYNVDVPAEPVIGFIGAGTVQQKRIYISKNDLPTSFYLIRDAACAAPALVEILKAEEIAGYFASGQNIPIDYGPGPGVNFYASSRYCADCTLRGTNKKPDFWQ